MEPLFILSSRSRWCLVAALSCVAAAVSLSARSENAYCTQARYDEDKAGMSQAFAMGVLKTEPPAKGVLVNDVFWQQMDFAKRVHFAKRLECALAGPGKILAEMPLHSQATGSLLATWSLGKLQMP